MERRGVTRREFNTWCLKLLGLMGVTALCGSEAEAQEAADKIAAMKRPVVMWLQLQECTGCLESTIRSYNEEIGNLVLSVVSMPYVELLMAPSGAAAEKSFHDAAEQPHILVVNGSVPVKENGVYCMIGGETAETVLRRAAKNATHVLAVGSCAYFGSIQAARPNPTGAVGVRDILTDIPVINVPGCPPIGDVITAVIMYILTFDKVPPCDGEGRPLMAYGTRIHNNCQRRAHFDAGQFVNSFDDENACQGFCLYKMGCKGPNTFSPCPIVKWNGGVSFPIQAGHPCIGCTELYFFDRMSPFYKTLPSWRRCLRRWPRFRCRSRGYSASPLTSPGPPSDPGASSARRTPTSTSPPTATYPKTAAHPKPTTTSPTPENNHFSRPFP